MKNSGTIFDLYEKNLPEGQEGYLELARNAPQPKDKSFAADLADYAKTALKGTIEGVSRLGQVMGPLLSNKSSAQQQEELSEMLDAEFPTEENYVQRGLRRGLKEIPTFVASAPTAIGQAVARSLMAGYAEEGAASLGAPGWLQAGVGLVALAGPNVTKKLLEQGSKKEIIEIGRKYGLSDEQIAPLLQSEGKQKFLSRLAKKTGGAVEKLAETKKGLLSAYNTLKNSPVAKQNIHINDVRTLLGELGQALHDIPAGVREKIKADLKDLISRPITPETLMNFYADVNHYIGDNAKQLVLLKEPVKKAIMSASPQIAKDFDMINDMYMKYHRIASKLKPGLKDQILSAVEAVAVPLGLGTAIATGNYSGLIGTLGEVLGRRVAREMLLNPKFQQFGQKFVVALNQNKYGLMIKTIDDMKKEVAKFSPEAAEKIKPMTEEEFKELLSHREKESKE